MRQGMDFPLESQLKHFQNFVFDLVDSGQSNCQASQIVYLYKYKLIQSYCCRMPDIRSVVTMKETEHEVSRHFVLLVSKLAKSLLNILHNFTTAKNNSNLQTLLTFLPDDSLTFDSLCN